MTATSPNLVYLNGDWLPLSEARVSVMDRGFLFGDGVYEVIPAYAGRLFRLSQHLDRLDNSLRALRLANPLPRDEWQRLLERLVAQRGASDQSVYLQVTRGVGAVRDHAIPTGVAATVFIMANPLQPPDPALQERGVAAITLDDLRWQLCQVKAITLLANVLAKAQAQDEGALEAILVRDGQAMEGSASNLFIVSNGLLMTPPKGRFLLPGVTRDLVLELAMEAGLPYAEASIGVAELEAAEEIWLTSSTREVLPVTQLNGRAVSDGQPGPVWRRMTGLYDAYKARLRLATGP